MAQAVMAATRILLYIPILPLAHQSIAYTVGGSADEEPLPMVHQRRFSLLMAPIPLVLTHWMKYSQLMNQKGGLEHSLHQSGSYCTNREVGPCGNFIVGNLSSSTIG